MARRASAASAPLVAEGSATAGALYVVATPIGNLADVTLRALETLRTVPLIAAEDTRITRRLLSRYDIATRTVSFHARSGPARVDELLAHLRGGADLALVTDAGTPVVSDPGADLIGAWLAEGGRVIPIPGASAVTAAVVASGIAGPRWSFEGFLPRSGRDRRDRLVRIALDDRASILFEAPTRLAATLRDLSATCGGERVAAVCRELTKVHEQVRRASLDELLVAVGEGSIPARGEIVIVVAGMDPEEAERRRHAEDVEEARDALVDARAAVDGLVAGGLTRAEAARRVAARTGLPRRALYRASSDG